MAECIWKHGNGCAIQQSADGLLLKFRAIPGNDNASMREAVESLKIANSGNPAIDELRKDLRGLAGCANCVFQGFNTVIE